MPRNNLRRQNSKNFSSKRIARKIPTGKYDYKLFFLLIVLNVIGSIMVYSGSAILAVKLGKTPYHYFVLHLMWIILGCFGAYIFYKIDYKHLPILAVPMMGVAFVLLIFVLIVNADNPIKRWIPIGPFTLQPSELAKFAFAIYLPGWLAKQKAAVKDTKQAIQNHLQKELVPFLLLLGFVALPIIIEPDLDTAIIIVVTSFIVYFISGIEWVHLLTTTFTGIIGVFIGYILVRLADYRLSRVLNWMQFWITGQIQEPFGEGYQLRQIIVAVASGGLLGTGFGNSRQKIHYLGETAFTDTIFAIFAEEFGFIGIVVLISMFAFFIIRGYKIAFACKDKLGFLLAISITTWIGLQAFFHIASNVALIPINGNTLPFFSYGGSSTLVNISAMGVLLNISKHVKLEK